MEYGFITFKQSSKKEWNMILKKKWLQLKKSSENEAREKQKKNEDKTFPELKLE